MVPIVLNQAKFRFVKASELRPQRGIPSRLVEVLLSQIPAIKEGKFLTPDAMVLFFAVNPPWVIRDDKTYRLVLTNGLGGLLEALPPNIQVPVLVLPKQKKNDMEAFYKIQLQAAFLQKIVYALDLSLAADSVVQLWDAMGKRERTELSPELETKSGLSRSTGLNHRTKPKPHKIVTPTFRQEELLEGIADVD